MHGLAVALGGLVVLMGGAAAPPQSLAEPPSAVPGASLFITGVAIIDPGSGSTSAPSDILIEAGRITAVAPTGQLAPPAGIERLDGKGRFAMPGLIDVHAHLGEGGVGPADEATRRRALKQFLRYGVTTIFVPGASGANEADFQALRQDCAPDPLACPGLYGSGSLITAPGSHPISTIFNLSTDPPAAAMEAIGVTMLDPQADIEALVAARQAAGVDAIKIIIEDGPPPWYPKPRLSDGQVRRIVEAAHRRDLPVLAHVSRSDHVRIALEAGVDGIMHAPIDRMPDDLLHQMAAQDMMFVATLSLYDGFVTWARGEGERDPYALAGVEPSALASLSAPPFLQAAAETEAGARAYVATASDNLRRAVAAGVPIALGTDVNNPFVFPGYSAHEELSWMVRAGLSPAQALDAGTVGSAAFLRASGRIGRVQPGHEADLLLLARNPLVQIENSRSLVAVISEGRIVPDVVGLP